MRGFRLESKLPTKFSSVLTQGVLASTRLQRRATYKAFAAQSVINICLDRQATA